MHKQHEKQNDSLINCKGKKLYIDDIFKKKIKKVLKKKHSGII